MKNRIIKRLTVVAVLCALVLMFAVPAASAASYSNVYGQTQDRVRVRASASTSATVIDNILKDACVYVLSTKTSGSSVFVQVRYRDNDGNTSTGWVCQSEGGTTYVKILSAEQAQKSFGVKGGEVPSKRVGTFTSAERNSAKSSGSSSSADKDTIKDAQTKLKALGIYSGEITGNVGDKTKAAIKEFQRRYGLTVDGVLGPQTLGKLDAAYAAKGGSSSTASSGGDIKLNSEGSDVRQLQRDLKELGFYSAEITGKVGAKTEAAIKAFQRKYGLTADGVAGAKTLAAIASALRGGTTNTGSLTIIREGSSGSRVSQLQQDLKTLGYYSAEITGHAGSKTVAAIRKFQERNGLTADGIAGPDTLAAISKQVGSSAASSGSGSSVSGVTLREGSSGAAVTELQKMLSALGYYYGDITGHFGSLTRQAVRKFQEANKLTVDGVAGPATLNKLRSLTGSGSSSSGSSGSNVGSAVETKDSYGRIIKDNVYLRSSYSTSSASKGSLKKGTYVRITRSVTSGGYTWYYISVQLNGYTQTGYVRKDMLELVSASDYKGSDAGYDYNDREILGTIRVTGSNVRLRTGPGTNYDIGGYAQSGDTYYYIATVSGWYQIRSGYWISASYARVLSGKEEEEFLDFNSNTSYGRDSTGSMVSFIQEALKALGFYDRTITGHYGENTEKAVKAFQARYGLKQTGIADKATIIAIRDAYYGSGNTTSPDMSDKTIYNKPWKTNGAMSSFYKDTVKIVRGATGKLMDLDKGLTLKVKVQSAGSNHADMEPLTSADTATLCKIFGVATANQIPYTRRAMILEMNGYKMLCSIYAEVHGDSTIPDNNYDGQFCLHFNGSTINQGDGGSVPSGQNHQDIIKKAAAKLRNENYTVIE